LQLVIAPQWLIHLAAGSLRRYGRHPYLRREDTQLGPQQQVGWAGLVELGLVGLGVARWCCEAGEQAVQQQQGGGAPMRQRGTMDCGLLQERTSAALQTLAGA
jgi:hypothetical protein